MVSSEEGPAQVAPHELQKRQSPDGGTDTTLLIHNSEGHVSRNQEQILPSNVPEISLENSGGHILQLDKEGSVSSIMPRKVSQTPGNDPHSLQSGQEGRALIMREKVSEDGYHWRKYGQKLVKGNEFIRSYYKCTHPNCQVKKQLECSHDGKLADIVYLGEHDHPKPQLNVPQAVGSVVSIVEEKPDDLSSTGVEESQAPHPIESANASQISTVTYSEVAKHGLSEPNRVRDEVENDDDPCSKRRKKGNCNEEPGSVDKPTGEPRLIIQTLSEVDIVNDGYRWRKYGQKLVRGNPNPRSYYRCSSHGCPVKKHVERASHDPKVVITSYEGQHDHDMPPSRIVTHNTTAIQNGELGAKSGEGDAISLDVVAYDSSDSNNKLKERVNSEWRSKLRGSNSGHESKLRELQDDKSSAMKESGAAGLNIVVSPNSVSSVDGSSEQQHIGESRIESKEKSTGCNI